MSERASYGWAVGPSDYGLRGIIARPEKSMAGNLVLQVGVENTDAMPGWHKVAHVVLTPEEAAALHAAIGEQIGVRSEPGHTGGKVPPVTEAETPGGAGLREAREAAARGFANVIEVDGDELAAAAEALWSNLNPQSTHYASALSAAGVALRAARQARDSAPAQRAPAGMGQHPDDHEHRPAAASITDRRGVAVLKGSRPDQYPLFGTCRDCAHLIACNDITADWTAHPAEVRRALMWWAG